MRDYLKLLLRMSILFVLVLAVMVLAKPKTALAFADCCTNCRNALQACENACTGTPLQISACKRGCQISEGRCIEVCPACIVE